MISLDALLNAGLADLDRQALRRYTPDAIDVPGHVVSISGRPAICLNSNDYLGLANHPTVKAAAKSAIDKMGCSSTGSRLMSGNLALHEELEARLANFKNSQAILLFSSGYAANIGVLGALAESGDLIAGDRRNHASLIDGARLSGAAVRHYRHLHTAGLEAILQKKTRYRRRFVVTDGVFSMDGDLAPLPEVLAICDRYEATAIVDEAHATGVVGPFGAGTLAHFGLARPDVIQVCTLGKALGGFGAFVACSLAVRKWLLNRSRSLIFSTSLPPAVSGAAIGALEVIDAEPDRVLKLRRNARYLRSGLQRLGFDVGGEPEIPIIPVMIGDPGRAVAFALRLRNVGLLVGAVRPPAVAPGKARIRLTVSAAHEVHHLDRALELFEIERRDFGFLERSS